ncbi:MAG TPA: DUF1634 domain-containing protein [Bacteroidota bacterium]|nr:DUF1634 domain-containing protein [Bacteroidota bacterium]
MANQLQRTERWVRRILRVGVWLSSSLMTISLILLTILEPQQGAIVSPALDEIFNALTHPTARTAVSLAYSGIFVLMLTPFFRVAASLVAFWSEGDWRYVGISGLVLIFLIGQLLYLLM